MSLNDIKRRVNLRPYQQNSIDSISKLLSQEGPQKILLNLPTGAGKTLVATYSLIEQQIKRGNSILWLANKWLHIRQFLKTLDANLEGFERSRLEIRIIGQNDTLLSFQQSDIQVPIIHYKKPDDNKIIIYVSTIQTLGRLDRQPELKSILDKVDTIVIDEAHWGIHGSLRMRIEDSIASSGVTCMALTATPKKGYSYDLVGGKDITYLELAKKGYLAKCVVHSIPTNRIFTEIVENGLSSLEKYAWKIKTIGSDFLRNSKIAETYINKMNEWGKTIIFCGSIEQANSIALLLKCPAIHSENYTGSSLTEIVKRFRTDSQCSVMTTVNMLNDGVDIPELKTIFLAFPTSSDVRFVQINGRATRNINGEKPFYNLVDFYDTFLKPGIAKFLDESALWYNGTFESDADDDLLSRECIELIENINYAKKELEKDVVKVEKNNFPKTNSHESRIDPEQYLKDQIKKTLLLFVDLNQKNLSFMNYNELSALGRRIQIGEIGYGMYEPIKDFSIFFDLHFNDHLFLPSTNLAFKKNWNPSNHDFQSYNSFMRDLTFQIMIEEINHDWVYESETLKIFKTHLIDKDRSRWLFHWDATQKKQIEHYKEILFDACENNALISDLLRSLHAKTKNAA